jgi:broad specificity phosphatase PhoE
MEIVLVRHGESDANRQGIIQGRGDYPLSDVGRDQARATSAALADFHPALIFTSPLGRARETAEIINQPHQVEIADLPELMEYNLGEFEGMRFEDVLTKYPAVRPGLKNGVPFHHLAPGAETDAEADERARRALALVLGSGRPRVLVVAHLGILERLLLAALDGQGSQIPASAWPLRNCSVTRLRVTAGRRELIGLNETGHLR